MAGTDASRATEAVLSFLPEALPVGALPLVRSLARQLGPTPSVAIPYDR